MRPQSSSTICKVQQAFATLEHCCPPCTRRQVLAVWSPALPDDRFCLVRFPDFQNRMPIVGYRSMFSLRKCSLTRPSGGLKLCYMLMTSLLLQSCKILYIATKAVWTWYGQEAQNCKSPLDNARHVMKMAGGAWARDGQFSETIKTTLYNQENLRFMGIAPGFADVDKHAGRALDLMWHLLSHRVWSTVARFSIAPECYAPLLSQRLDDRRAAAEGMRRPSLQIREPAEKTFFHSVPICKPAALLHRKQELASHHALGSEAFGSRGCQVVVG